MSAWHALLGRGSHVTEVVLDLAGLEFLDVTGLGALLETRRKLAAAGATLTLRRPRPMVVRMLALLDLETSTAHRALEAPSTRRTER